MRTRVKICGITNPGDAAHAVAEGADAVGLNFAPRSPRFLTLDRALAIRAVLPPMVTAIGIFVEPEMAALEELAEAMGLRVAQTYSARPLTPRELHPLQHIAAFRVAGGADLDAILTYVRQARPSLVVVDSFVAGVEGGTGHTGAWDLLEGYDWPVPWVLAGGLTPENVGPAIERLRPWGVDVTTGVEASPGVKDPRKVTDFIQAVVGADARLGREKPAGRPPAWPASS